LHAVGWAKPFIGSDAWARGAENGFAHALTKRGTVPPAATPYMIGLRTQSGRIKEIIQQVRRS
jgi:hypothetical protein